VMRGHMHAINPPTAATTIGSYCTSKQQLQPKGCKLSNRGRKMWRSPRARRLLTVRLLHKKHSPRRSTSATCAVRIHRGRPYSFFYSNYDAVIRELFLCGNGLRQARLAMSLAPKRHNFFDSPRLPRFSWSQSTTGPPAATSQASDQQATPASQQTIRTI